VDLVFLHGPAASGKLTVARALEAAVGFPVFHNHLVVDLLTTVFPPGCGSNSPSASDRSPTLAGCPADLRPPCRSPS
jgi:hypothetical protein